MSIRPTQAVIDLVALRHNLRLIAQFCPSTPICALVKANAYGHGLEPIAAAIEKSGGASWLGVALVEEGIRLRAHGVRLPVLVVGGAWETGAAALVRHELTPVVSRREQLGALAAALPAGARFAFHVELDTGMSRLGLSASELDDFLAALDRMPQLRLAGTMTHLANTDERDPSVTLRQLARFDELCERMQRQGVTPGIRHAANSGAVMAFPNARLGLVRPGLMLYGIDPRADRATSGLEPVMRWTTQVIKIRTIETGSPVSYGGRWHAPPPGPSRVATLPVGYADGYRRALSGRAHVLIRGQRAPVVGSVCMDLCMVDVTRIRESCEGDEVVLLGRQGQHEISAYDMAQWADTIPYEIVCGVSSRVPRRYSDGAT